MKKSLVAAAALFVAVASTYAQGTIAFVNSSTTLVRYTAGSLAIPLGDNVFAMLYAGPDAGSLTPWGAPTAVGTTGTLTVAGRFNGGTVTINSVAPGAIAFLQVRAWTGVFANYEAAVSGGTAAGGVSSVFQLSTGGSGTPASSPTSLTSAGGFAGMSSVAPVPEPATIALAVLGMGALVALRRRK